MFEDFSFVHGLLCAQASQISFTRYLFTSSINYWSFTNQPSVPFEYALGTSNRFSWMSTYGRALSPVGGLEEAEDYGIGGEASTWPLTAHLGQVLGVGGWGGRRFSSIWLRGGGSNIALGLRKRIFCIKKEGGSRWGWGLELETGARGDSLGFQQLTSSHPFSGMVMGTRTEH